MPASAAALLSFTAKCKKAPGAIITCLALSNFIFSLVIHAYNYLRSKIEVEDRVGSYNNTSTNIIDTKSDKADELPMSPVEPVDEEHLKSSTGPPSGATSPTTAAAHQATLSAQANLTAANMALAIFKNAPKPPPPRSPLSVSPQLKIKTDTDETIQIDSDQTDTKDEVKQEPQSATTQPPMGQSAFSMNLGPVNQGTALVNDVSFISL